MTHILHRHTKANYPMAVAGDGCYIIDSSGKKYLDACCGAAVSCLGHNNAEVKQAIIDQLNKIPFAHTSFFTNEPSEKLASLLADKAPSDMNRVYFVSGGSEANESALKIARQYFFEQGKNSKSIIIGRQQSYHGNTLAALAVGSNLPRRVIYEPLLLKMEHIEPCYEYRSRKDGESAEEYGLRAANELENRINKVGADNVAAFIAEPVVGSTMGCVPAVKGYFKRVREICNKHDVLLIFDEIMCGSGRTGTLFACEQEGIMPDIITMAKGIGAGYQPIGAMVISDKIYDTISSGSGFFQHGHTYIGHPTACASALATQEIIQRDGLLDKVKKQGQNLRKALQDNFGEHEYIGDIRGKGLFLAMEIVKNRKNKVPFDPELKIHTQIKKIAFENGLMCYPMGGTIDGKSGDHIMLAPPFIIEEKHIDEIIEKLKLVFKNIF